MKKIFTILFILFVMTGCEQKGDYISNGIPNHLLTNLAHYVYEVETVLWFKSQIEEQGTKEEKRTGNPIRIRGSAFVIDKYHLITAKHVSTVEFFQVLTPYGSVIVWISSDKKGIEETYLLLDNGDRIKTKVVYRDERLDFAILECEEELPIPYYFIGDSDKFDLMDKVILVSDFGYGMCVRLGYITQLDFVIYKEDLMTKERDDNLFGVSTFVSKGDSGGPVFLFRNGKVEIGGVIIMVTEGRGIGFAIKINPIANALVNWYEERSWVCPLFKNG